MTNMIQFPLSLAGTVANNGLISKQSATLTNSGFNDLFSTLLSDINSISGTGDINSSSSDLMSSMLMTVFSKLFGEDASELNLQPSKPQGIPVNGVLTQSSHEGHVALDFGVPIGTSVKSTMNGKVTYAGWNNEGYGNLVIVENGAYKTYYAHLSSIPVRKGQTINEGEVIGLSGNTGNSTGPHLHYEIRKDGVAVNPLGTMKD
jgi:murein DD-endopeptidase MepM/ murein hydrolase activator NlpD